MDKISGIYKLKKILIFSNEYTFENSTIRINFMDNGKFTLDTPNREANGKYYIDSSNNEYVIAIMKDHSFRNKINHQYDYDVKSIMLDKYIQDILGAMAKIYFNENTLKYRFYDHNGDYSIMIFKSA